MNKNIDEKTLIARAEDTAQLCEKQYSPKAFGFLTPAECAMIKRNFSTKGFGADICFKFFGGYQEAERCLFLAFPDYAEETVDDEFISLIEIRGRDIGALNHRDFLGSILGLGIKREKIGDILCLEDRCCVFALSDIADYIVTNLDKVARCGVSAQIKSLRNVELPKRRVEEINATVAALRLDCVLAAALKTSRTTAAEVIRSKRVSVNWQEVCETSQKVAPGDVFSVRGEGRFRLAEDMRETRKGRISVCIEKFI
jgi:RNA-binding protein YlmH